MPPELLHELESLSSSHAPQLVVGLAVCGILLLIVPDHRLATLALLVQRSLVIALIWSAIQLPLGSATIVASVALGLIYLVTELRLWYVQMRGELAADRHWPSPIHLPFRALAAALGLLVTYGLVQAYLLDLLPLIVAFPVVLLIVNGFLVLLLADSALRTGMGILTLTDSLRILYALWQPDPLVWGLWSACDVLVVLGASHLRNAEVLILKGPAAGGLE